MMNDLSHDLAQDIAHRLHAYWDYTNFRSACKSLRSAVPKKPATLPRVVPCLVHPCNETHCNFFSLFGETYKLELPEVQTQLCKGSSQGWLITVERGPCIRLINPLTNTRMQLPPIHAFPDVLEYNHESLNREYLISTVYRGGIHRNVVTNSTWVRKYFIRRLVLSSSPSEENCMAMALYSENSNKVAFCKVGDKEWRIVEDGGWSCLHNIMHYDGKLYIVDQYGRVFVVQDDELKSASPKARMLVDSPTHQFVSNCRLYLVVIKGELLMVDRKRDWKTRKNYYKTTGFRIFKLNLSSISHPKWCKVTSLGDNMLFLGQNDPFCVSTRDVSPPWKGNCIYYTDDYIDGHFDRPEKVSAIAGADLGVFDLKTRITRPLPLPSGIKSNRQRGIWPLPIWVQPNN
ncbi:hypothetical protein ACHQM5_012110 [Ranunculus cassubicifolius]